MNTIVSSLTSSRQSYSNSLTNKSRGKQRGKKGRNKKNKNKENQPGKSGERIPKKPGGTHKRTVTVNKNFKTFKNIPWSTNNSGNQENHSWPSPEARETVNANDIDRRLDVGRKGDDYSKLLQEYESVQSQGFIDHSERPWHVTCFDSYYQLEIRRNPTSVVFANDFLSIRLAVLKTKKLLNLRQKVLQ